MGYGDLCVFVERREGCVSLLRVPCGVCCGAWEASSSAFSWFRADDCFVCVSLQELLPEEILQAVLAVGKGERRRTKRWGKCQGWASPGSTT